MQPITQEERLCAQELVDFIAECPSMFHTVYAACTRLDEAGFTYVPESHAWEVVPGGRYYTTRNGSSVIAFAVGEHALDDRDAFHFQLAAAHADSPAFKIKSAPELEGPEGYLRLNAEAYGGTSRSLPGSIALSRWRAACWFATAPKSKAVWWRLTRMWRSSPAWPFIWIAP